MAETEADELPRLRPGWPIGEAAAHIVDDVGLWLPAGSRGALAGRSASASQVANSAAPSSGRSASPWLA